MCTSKKNLVCGCPTWGLSCGAYPRVGPDHVYNLRNRMHYGYGTIFVLHGNIMLMCISDTGEHPTIYGEHRWYYYTGEHPTTYPNAIILPSVFFAW